MRLRPDLQNQDHWEDTRAEGKNVLERLGIDNPRCGFGIAMGWMPTVERALEKMIAAGWDKDLHQVKQKFCGLRIYIGAGTFENVDNPVKRFFRRPVIALAQNQEIWPKHRKDGLGRILYKIFSTIHIALWDLSRSRLLREHKTSEIARIIEEAEAECDRLCENCGNEREKKGHGTGMALCNTCGVPMEPR